MKLEKRSVWRVASQLGILVAVLLVMENVRLGIDTFSLSQSARAKQRRYELLLKENTLCQTDQAQGMIEQGELRRLMHSLKSVEGGPEKQLEQIHHCQLRLAESEGKSRLHA